MDPTEKSELLLEITSLEGRHESNKTKRIQRKAKNSMVCGEQSQVCIRKYNMLQRSGGERNRRIIIR